MEIFHQVGATRRVCGCPVNLDDGGKIGYQLAMAPRHVGSVSPVIPGTLHVTERTLVGAPENKIQVLSKLEQRVETAHTNERVSPNHQGTADYADIPAEDVMNIPLTRAIELQLTAFGIDVPHVAVGQYHVGSGGMRLDMVLDPVVGIPVVIVEESDQTAA